MTKGMEPDMTTTDGWGGPMVVITDCLEVLQALEGVKGRPIAWAAMGAPVIDRGAHAIFPLAVAAVQPGRGAQESASLAELARNLELHCIHFHGGDGFHAEMALKADAGYGRRLVETSALLRTPRYWWGIGRFAVVLVHALEQQGEFESLALHVIPKDWVWHSPITPSTKRGASQLRRIVREQESIGGAADVLWSWPLEKQAQGMPRGSA